MRYEKIKEPVTYKKWWFSKEEILWYNHWYIVGDKKVKIYDAGSHYEKTDEYKEYPEYKVLQNENGKYCVGRKSIDWIECTDDYVELGVYYTPYFRLDPFKATCSGIDMLPYGEHQAVVDDWYRAWEESELLTFETCEEAYDFAMNYDDNLKKTKEELRRKNSWKEVVCEQV